MSQRIFITGGASGLGLAIAKYYLHQGWQVAIGDVNDEAGRALVDEWGEPHLYFHCDVTEIQQLEAVRDQLVKTWGGVDVVVNNAGVAGAGSFGEISWQDWQWMIDIDLKGVIAGCQVFVDQFREQGHGHFVNVASMAGLMMMPYMSHYNVAKAGVIALSETLSFELTPENIHTTVVCPSFFQTNLTDTMRAPDPRFVELTQKLLKRSDINGDDIAKMIFNAVEKKQLWLLPHKQGRTMWRVKRWLPSVFGNLMRKSARKVFRFAAEENDGSKATS